MEDRKENPQGKRKIADYVRWIFVATFLVLFVVTIIMAAYRKFTG